MNLFKNVQVKYFQSGSNTTLSGSWLLWVSITLSIVAWALGTFQGSIDSCKLETVRQIGFTIAFFLVRFFDSHGIQGAVLVVTVMK